MSKEVDDWRPAAYMLEQMFPFLLGLHSLHTRLLQQARLRELKAIRDRERATIRRLQEAQEDIASEALLKNMEVTAHTLITVKAPSCHLGHPCRMH